jgi:transcriptional regulator with XRE-family HTH domain
MRAEDKSFATLFEEAEESAEYWQQDATLDFAEELFRLLEEEGVSRAELARRIGTSQAYVTQVLRADANFTLNTMTRLALAVDHRVRIHLAPKHSTTVWRDSLYFPEDSRLRQDFQLDEHGNENSEGVVWDEASVHAA